MGAATPSERARMASIMYGTNSRLTTKPELFLQTMGSLPSDFAKAKAVSNTAGSVAMVLTTSTSFITGTGVEEVQPHHPLRPLGRRHHVGDGLAQASSYERE